MKLRPLVPTLVPGEFAARRAWPRGVYVSMADETQQGSPPFTPVLTDGFALDDWCLYTATADDFVADDWEYATP